MTKALLDELAEKLSHAYLSDLKGDVGTSALQACIASIPPGEHPPAEWAECVRYLLCDRAEVTSEEDARRRFTAHPTGPEGGKAPLRKPVFKAQMKHTGKTMKEEHRQ